MITQEAFASKVGTAVAESGSLHLTGSISVLGQTAEPEGDVQIGETPEDVRFDVKLAVVGIDIEARLIGTLVYANLGGITDGKFATIDLADDGPFAAEFGGIQDQVDLPSLLDSFEGAISSFEPQGDPETIDGVQAQPYVVTLDTAKIADAQEAGAANVPAELTYTLFVGPDNLPRRVVIDRGGAQDTLEFSRWGEPVDIQAPADEDRTDIDLVQLFMGLFGQS